METTYRVLELDAAPDHLPAAPGHDGHLHPAAHRERERERARAAAAAAAAAARAVETRWGSWSGRRRCI